MLAYGINGLGYLYSVCMPELLSGNIATNTD